MSKNINFIDYDVLQQGETVYANQANAINDVIKALQKMNGDMREGWSNETAIAFVDRIENDHIKKLELAAIAIADVAKYIKDYGLGRKDEDTTGASQIRI